MDGCKSCFVPAFHPPRLMHISCNNTPNKAYVPACAATSLIAIPQDSSWDSWHQSEKILDLEFLKIDTWFFLLLSRGWNSRVHKVKIDSPWRSASVLYCLGGQSPELLKGPRFLSLAGIICQRLWENGTVCVLGSQFNNCRTQWLENGKWARMRRPVGYSSRQHPIL